MEENPPLNIYTVYKKGNQLCYLVVGDLIWFDLIWFDWDKRYAEMPIDYFDLIWFDSILKYEIWNKRGWVGERMNWIDLIWNSFGETTVKIKRRNQLN